MFVSFAESLNRFIMGCQKVFLVNRAHLSGPYKGTLLAAITLNVDDHLFEVPYAVAGKEDKEEWYWFFSMLFKCLGGLKLVIISDQHDGLLDAIPRVFRA